MKRLARRLAGTPDGRRALATCLILLALALAIRLIGVDWHGRHPDEDIGGPVRLLSGNPHAAAFFYPPLLTYLVAVADLGLFAAGRIAGWWNSTAGFRDAYFATPTPFFVTARIVVAACAAALAPIAYLLARELGRSRASAIVVGGIAALLPGPVFWAHIAKSDSALAPAFLLTALAALRLCDAPRSLARAWLVGLAVALSVSFKQSAIFFLVPLLLVMVGASVARRGIAPAARGWAIALLAAILCWLPMNFGVLLDPGRFLAAQVVQSQMSARAAPLAVTVRVWFGAMTSADTGLPALALAGGAAAILLGITFADRRTRFLLAGLALACAFATVVIAAIGGSRQPDHLWLPYVTVAAVAAMIAAVALVEGRRRVLQAIGAAILLLLAASSLLRLMPVLRQLTAPSQGSEVAALVARLAPPGARILSNVDLAGVLPIAPESQRLERARHERIAARYGIRLSPPERPLAGVPGGYVVLDYPFAIGGLEQARPGGSKVVLPYAWPLQPDEWDFAAWRARGFRLFVVRDPLLFDDQVPAYRTFFRALARQCPRAAALPASRPLLGEVETRVYRCA